MNEDLIIKNLGADPFERPIEETEKDYKHEELGTAGATILDWKEFTPEDLIGLPVKRQNYTSECAAQSGAKHLAAVKMRKEKEYKELCAEFVYDFRINKGTANHSGMIWTDLMQILTKVGACRHDRMEQRIRESDPVSPITQAMIDEALERAGYNFFTLNEITMDSVAEMIESQGSGLLWFWFDVEGTEFWQEEPKIRYPTLGTFDRGATRHALFAAKYGLLNGEKRIIIDDSANNKTAINNQKRFITEDFLKRCYKAGYIIDKEDLPKPPSETKAPKVYLTQYMKSGYTGKEVSQLQAVLIYEGFLKVKKPTGLFAGLTRQAVKDFQAFHGLKSDGIVGPITREYINKKYK